MSPRTRITANVDFEVDVETNKPRQHRSRTRTMTFRVPDNEPAMSAWLEDHTRNRASTIARLVDEFVKRNGTDDLFEELPVEGLMSPLEEWPAPHVTLKKASSLTWLGNQRNASASIRHVIRQQLSEPKRVRTPSRSRTQALRPTPTQTRRLKTSGPSNREILAQVDLCIFHTDAKLVNWLGAQSNRQSSIRRALEMFTQKHGSYTLSGTRTSTFHRAEDHARLIHLNIYDERIAHWLGDQVDPSGAVRHALRWYVDECTSTMVEQPHRAQGPSMTIVAPIPTQQRKTPARIIPVGVGTSVKTTAPGEIERHVAEILERITALTTEISSLRSQVYQLSPGSLGHRI